MSAKILLAEDDDLLVESLGIYLEQKGYQVTTARDGAEAIRLLSKEKPDILLLDILMPNVDGIAVIEKIHQNGWEKEMPVIVLSNLSKEIDQKKCEDLGAKGFIIKSDTSLEDIAAIVEKHLKAASHPSK